MERVRRLPPWAADTLLALALAVPTSSAAFADPGAGFREPAWLVLPLLALTVLPLAARRYSPVPVFGVTLGAATISWTLTSGPLAGLSGIAQGKAKLDIRLS